MGLGNIPDKQRFRGVGISDANFEGGFLIEGEGARVCIYYFAAFL